MQSSLRLSKIKPASAIDKAESSPAVLHAAFEEIEKRWGLDSSRVPVARKAYPQIPEWEADQPNGQSRLSNWSTYFRRIFSYMHKTQKN
ncbi:MAG: hypothetical protein GYA42_06380 [Syntrophomonadaceae bacterium]|nr:hypothetical protein [Syntrophomonadaceae bacterium]